MSKFSSGLESFNPIKKGPSSLESSAIAQLPCPCLYRNRCTYLDHATLRRHLDDVKAEIGSATKLVEAGIEKRNGNIDYLWDSPPPRFLPDVPAEPPDLDGPEGPCNVGPVLPRRLTLLRRHIAARPAALPASARAPTGSGEKREGTQFIWDDIILKMLSSTVHTG